MLSLVTHHGRATPLVWLTVDKKTLKDRRNRYEDRVLVRLAEILPANVKVCVLADRGFGARVTAEKYAVGTVVCVQEKDMKQAWCLAASSPNAAAKQLIRYCGNRWGIECGVRDTKDLRFGMGMDSVHVNSPERRDRLWLINAPRLPTSQGQAFAGASLAVVLLTLLGAASEAVAHAGCSRPTPPNAGPNPCSVKAACSTT